jgi:hypothetical protein
MRLHIWFRAGLADEIRSDAMPDAASGEGGHGVAKSDRVIHTCISKSSFCCLVDRALLSFVPRKPVPFPPLQILAYGNQATLPSPPNLRNLKSCTQEPQVYRIA